VPSGTFVCRDSGGGPQARIYDYLLGGHNNLPVDREVADALLALSPVTKATAVENRRFAQGRSLLTNESHVTMAEGDLRQPADILALPELHRLLDLRRPIALLLLGVLYFISDDEDPYGIVTQLRDALAPGSYLVISHAASDTVPPDQLAEGTRIYNRASGVTLRTRPQIERFLEGVDLVEPGLVLVSHWRQDGRLPSSDGTPAMFGGIGQLHSG
jgi:S-adenosyl methyltransferase